LNCIQSGFEALKTASSWHDNIHQTLSVLNYNYSVWGRDKVDIIRGQPMNTIGWHHAN